MIHFLSLLLVFVIHAKSGMYQDGELTLNEVSPTVTYFSDTPQRSAKTIALGTFLDDWSDQIREGGIVFFEESDERFSEIPIELHHPRYNPNQRKLLFRISYLEKKEFESGRHLNEVTLFLNKP